MKDDTCVFCCLPFERIVSSCSQTITFMDGYPVSKGHTLIIPRRHIGGFFQLTKDEMTAIQGALLSAKNSLVKEFSPDGFNIGVNDGIAAGQTVMHLHIHLIPRYLGDSPDPRGGIRHVFPGKARYWE